MLANWFQLRVLFKVEMVILVVMAVGTGSIERIASKKRLVAGPDRLVGAKEEERRDAKINCGEREILRFVPAKKGGANKMEGLN